METSERVEGGGDSPVVLSATVQEFRGERYYRCGWYFQRKGRRLHRVVWESAHGPIPPGWHVHHVDGDRCNNALGTLRLLPARDHLSHHQRERGPTEIGDAARLAAAKWHGSDAGKRWHAEHFERHCRAAVEAREERRCQHCGGLFLGAVSQRANGKWCGPNCKARALRKRRADAGRAAGLLPDGA